MAELTNNQKRLKKLCDRQGNICYHCHKQMTASVFPPIQSTATVDHLLPISLGGKHLGKNCVAACHGCNQKKGHKITEEQKQKYIALGYARGAAKEKPIFMPAFGFGYGSHSRG